MSGRLDERPTAFAVACSRRLLAARQRQELYEQLALATGAGMRETEAVTFIWRVRTRDGRQDRLNPLSVFCRDAAFALNHEGRSLPEVFLRWSSGVERPLLVAAVTRGGNAEMYRELSEQLKSAIELRRALGNVLAHVVLLVLVAAGIASFLAFYFFPAVENFIDLDTLPGAAGSLYVAAVVFRNYWHAIAVGSLAIAVGASFALPRLTGAHRDALDSFEPFRTYRMVTAGMFLAGASILLRTGVNERQALALLRRHASPYLAERIRRLERIDAALGDRINRLEGIWPDRQVRIEAVFAASAADPIEEYARIGTGLIRRAVRHCSRLASASAWISSFLLVAAIIWILVATNEFSESIHGAWR